MTLKFCLEQKRPIKSSFTASHTRRIYKMTSTSTRESDVASFGLIRCDCLQVFQLCPSPQFVHWGPITSASRLKKTRMLIKCKLLSPFNNCCLHHRACAPVRPRLISRTTGPVKPAINWSPLRLFAPEPLFIAVIHYSLKKKTILLSVLIPPLKLSPASVAKSNSHSSARQ